MKGIDRDHEIIFMDDCRTDESILVLKDLARHDPKVKFLNLSRNFGQQAATSCIPVEGSARTASRG